ncbi:DHA1 family bicyclomycin/chloramphenicol resistance-like MFS transporter [Saccharothrix ecbatanensis]|uniref:DHA1 family bicyclomycin/chloramphenicol resistance-like MFS transporter n=1 Tax=Saccharothrix ecbatanensis TaxID=1105145 RepID=A0A7W9HNH3_9PSEU|nr:multidrug effflux MFS transporter [Saccharothrix ecbatanensis]MBB5805133.1 DHA1 family bicyclomycin/chloramphenicol resistance-like MFS transporter [Saccharothrix ecbatanensis]
MDNRTRLVVLLGSLCLLGPLSIDMYLPGFPAIAAEFGAAESQIQLSLTTFILGLSAGQLVVGPLSDSWGRRRPLLVGIGSYVVISLICAVAPNAFAFAGLRLLQGLGVAAGFVIAMAVARDRFEGVAMARFMSLMMLVNSLGPVLAPVLGGQLLRFTSWRGTFVVLGVLGLLLLIALAVGLPETLPQSKRRPANLLLTLKVFGGLLADRKFLGYALASALALGALLAYVAGGSFTLQNVYGLTPQQFSLVFALNSVAVLLAGLLNTALTGRVMPRPLLKIGMAGCATGGVGLLIGGLVGGGLVTFLPPLFLLTMSVGLLMPNASTLAMSRHPEAAGSASAVLGVTTFLVGGLMAPLVGAGGSASVLPMVTVMASATVLAVILFATLTRGDVGITRDTDPTPIPA